MDIRGVAEELLSMAQSPHSDCNWETEKCRAEQYGDGSASEHELLREAERLFHAGPEKVIINVRGGIAELVYKPENMQVEILDFDNDDEEEGACDCLVNMTGESDFHSHEVTYR
jgi:hypothetical protein